MLKVCQSMPVISGLAVVGLLLYSASIYLAVLDRAHPGMPLVVGSYCLGSAMILYLLRRGWKSLAAILLGVVLVAALNFTLARLEDIYQPPVAEQSQDPAVELSAKMESIQSRIDALGINTILRADRLISAKSIADSRKRLVKFAMRIQQRDALVRQYLAGNERNLEPSRGETTLKQNTFTKWSELSKAQYAMIALSYDILDFVGDNLEDVALRKDEIIFKTPDQVRRYTEMTNRMSEIRRIELEAWKAIDCLSGKSRLCVVNE